MAETRAGRQARDRAGTDRGSADTTQRDWAAGERAAGDRPASADDIHEIAMSLREVTVEATPRGRPVYQVRGKSFVFFRGPRKDAMDPQSGEPMDDVVGIRTPSEEDKFAMAQSPGPWFTTPHFNGFPAILIRLRDIADIGRDELAEVITDGWLSRAPKTLARGFEEALPDPARGLGR
jgi:hypothetical protein